MNSILDDRTPSKLIGNGLVYVPQSRNIFPSLTVSENLKVSLDGLDLDDFHQRIERIVNLFPVVASKSNHPAGKLSGGEKQQVALAMALLKKTAVLLLDEPSLGLSPDLVKRVFDLLNVINKELNVTMLIIEHKVREVFRISDHVLGLRRGEIVYSGAPDSFDDPKLKSLFLG